MRNAVTTRVTTIAALGMLAGVSMRPAYAAETACVSMLVGVTVDNRRVPRGKTCTLNATRVNGTLKVERDAMLYATWRGVNVVGNVQAENARQVSVTEDSMVGGSIQHPDQAGRRGDNTPCPGDGRYPVRVQLGGRSTVTGRRNS